MKTRAKPLVTLLVVVACLQIVYRRDEVALTSTQHLRSDTLGTVVGLSSEHPSTARLLPEIKARTGEIPQTQDLRTAASAPAPDSGTIFLGINTPSDSEPGAVLFQVQLTTEARRPAKKITLAVNFDPAVLRVVGVHSSEFVGRPGDLANFSTRLPANGEGAVLISWEGRTLTGTGILGYVEFEMHSPGSSEVGLSDIEVSDERGGRVDVPAPEPVRIEPHYS